MKKRVAYFNIDGILIGGETTDFDISFDVPYAGNSIVPMDSTFSIDNLSQDTINYLSTNKNEFTLLKNYWITKEIPKTNSRENNYQPWMVKDSSPDYNALANYGLATVMNKVLHLSKEGNQFVLTPYGFMTFSERIKQLLKTNN